MTNIIDTMDIMDIIEEEPCSVKVDMTLLKNPRICVNLKILDVDVVILVHLTTDAFKVGNLLKIYNFIIKL